MCKRNQEAATITTIEKKKYDEHQKINDVSDNANNHLKLL